MAQSPVPFMSRQPAMAARKANEQQFIQNMVDRNKVEKARMEQIKSLKQIAKGYGASAAQVESSSFGELQGFVKRLEIERANETREEQARHRELQMRQSRQATMLAAGQASREAKLREDKRSLYRGLLTSPGTQLTPEGEALTSELEGYESAAQPFLEALEAVGMSPEQIARAEQAQADQIASFQQRLAGSGMHSPLPSPAEQMFPGRPQVQAFIRKAVEEEQNPELAFGMAAKMADALPSREVALRAAMSGGGSTGGSGYFFSESEAVQAYEQAARSQGIPPTKEQTDAFVASANVKDLEKIRSAAVRTVKRFQLDTAKDVIGTSERLEKMILDIERDDTTGAVISGGVKTLVARLFEPVGILTEDDKNQYAGAGGLKTKIAQTWEDLMTGTLGEEQIDAIRAAVRILEEDAKETLREDGEKAVRSVASGYEISLQDAVTRTALSEYLLPPKADPTQPNQSQASNQPGWTNIPGSDTRFKKN